MLREGHSIPCWLPFWTFFDVTDLKSKWERCFAFFRSRATRCSDGRICFRCRRSVQCETCLNGLGLIVLIVLQHLRIRFMLLVKHCLQMITTKLRKSLRMEMISTGLGLGCISRSCQITRASISCWWIVSWGRRAQSFHGGGVQVFDKGR